MAPLDAGLALVRICLWGFMHPGLRVDGRAGQLVHSIIPELEKKVQQARSSCKRRMLSDTVTEEHVAEVVSRTTGIPVGALLQGEVSTNPSLHCRGYPAMTHSHLVLQSERLLHMEEELRKRVVGQYHAIAVVSSCVRLARAGLRAHEKPLGVFMFLGPTG